MENKRWLIKYTTQEYLSVPLVMSQSTPSLLHSYSICFIYPLTFQSIYSLYLNPSIHSSIFFTLHCLKVIHTYGHVHWTEYIQYSIYSTSNEVCTGYQCQVVKVHNNSTVYHIYPSTSVHSYSICFIYPLTLQYICSPILFCFFFHLQNFK